jgi:hypothetical protein
MIGLTPSGDAGSGVAGAPRGESRASAPARSAQALIVLFVAHLNTGASIMAEAILRHLAQGRWQALCSISGRERTARTNSMRVLLDRVPELLVERRSVFGAGGVVGRLSMDH